MGAWEQRRHALCRWAAEAAGGADDEGELRGLAEICAGAEALLARRQGCKKEGAGGCGASAWAAPTVVRLRRPKADGWHPW